MVDIKLKEKQNGYNVVGEYIRRYWDHNIPTDVIVSLGASYDGETYRIFKDVATPMNYDDIEFFSDWWEGEKYIKLFGIKSIEEIDVNGGIYD